MHRRPARVAVAAAALLLATLVSGCSLQPDVSTRVQQLQLTDSPAPALSGSSLTGTTIDLSADRGHPVVLDFWASWCGPCREEQPETNTLAATYMKKGVRFIGVDIRDDRANATAFVSEFGVAYPSLFDPGSDAAAAFNVDAPPTTIVVDARGNIRVRDLGNLNDIGPTLDALLGGTA